jgi:molybdenum-dependent DNA-binding transcriptional regulator ModE
MSDALCNLAYLAGDYTKTFSELTPFARQIVERYRKLKALTETAADRFFDAFFTLK